MRCRRKLGWKRCSRSSASKHEAARYSPTLEELLLASTSADSGEATNFLASLHRAGVDTDRTALRFLESRRFVSGALMFLARSNNRETLIKLEKMPVPAPFQQIEESISESIDLELAPQSLGHCRGRKRGPSLLSQTVPANLNLAEKHHHQPPGPRPTRLPAP